MRDPLLQGVIPATFTPFLSDGSLHLDRIPEVVDHLITDKASALYVLGTTGEGVSLTTEERKAVAEAYTRAAGGRLPVVVQVGHESVAEAARLAEHAQQIGADAVSATPPSYFRPESVEMLVRCVAAVAGASPGLPFYYYHIPKLTGVELDMVEFLEAASDRVPTFAGVKFSDRDVNELRSGARLDGERFEMLFGVDEMLLDGLAAGASGAVGTTYNFAAPLYRRIMRLHDEGKREAAAHWQERAVLMVETILRAAGRAGFKAVMRVIGIDCGGQRLPLPTATTEEVDAMTRSLEEIGFFEWGRSEVGD